MTGTDTPGEFEQIVLMALAGAPDGAPSREVYEAIVEATDRDVAVAAVHITLSRLVEKGWAEVCSPPPDREAETRARKFYALTPAGARLLSDLRERFDRLWAVAEGHPFLAGEGEAGR